MTTLDDVFATIEDRKVHPKEGSYVNRLLSVGPEAVHEKIAEESAEVIEASQQFGPKEIIHETADVLFHLCVLLAAHNLTLQQVYDELQRRQKPR